MAGYKTYKLKVRMEPEFSDRFKEFERKYIPKNMIIKEVRESASGLLCILDNVEETSFNIMCLSEEKLEKIMHIIPKEAKDYLTDFSAKKSEVMN